MSLWEGVLCSGLRATVAAVLAWCGGLAVAPAARSRIVVLALLLGLLVTPPLVVAYAWSGVLGVTEPGGFWRQLICAALMAARLLPVAVAVLCLCPPPPLSAAASHCLELAPHDSAMATLGWRRWWWWLSLGSGRRHLLALAILFLLGFGEFELSSLLMLPAWTVWVFDAQAGGAPLAETLWSTSVPVLIEVVVIAGGLSLLLARGKGRGVEQDGQPSEGPRPLLWPVLLVSAGIGCLFPLVLALRELPIGIRLTLGDGRLLHELLVSMALSLVATLAAMMLAGLVLRRKGLTLLWCLPGLLGALVVALVLQGLFQVPGFATAYDTPLPLVLALTLLLLPLATVLRSALGDLETNPSRHAAVLLQRAGAEQRRSGRLVLVSMVGKRRVLAALVLVTVVYFEVVASALLAPVHMTPASVRLYNLMHYGQSAVLSGMVALMILCLCVPLGAAWAAHAFQVRRHGKVAHG